MRTGMNTGTATEGQTHVTPESMAAGTAPAGRKPPLLLPSWLDTVNSLQATPEQLASMLRMAAAYIAREVPLYDVQCLDDATMRTIVDAAYNYISYDVSDESADSEVSEEETAEEVEHRRFHAMEGDEGLRTPSDDGGPPSPLPRTISTATGEGDGDGDGDADEAKVELPVLHPPTLRGMFASMFNLPGCGASAVTTGIAVLKDGELLARRLRAEIVLPRLCAAGAPEGQAEGVRLTDMSWAELASPAFGRAAAYGDLATCTTKVDGSIRRARELLAPGYKPEEVDAPRLVRLDMASPYLAMARDAAVEALFPAMPPDRACRIRLVPQKLNRYMAGDHFAWHVDTPRPNALASLVVCLGYAKPPACESSMLASSDSASKATWVSREQAVELGVLELLPFAAGNDLLRGADDGDDDDAVAGQERGHGAQAGVHSADTKPVRITAQDVEAALEARRVDNPLVQRSKRRALQPTGVTVREHPVLGPVLRVGMGAVAFYRNVRHRVTPCGGAGGGDGSANEETLPAVARFSMTFALEMAPEEDALDLSESAATAANNPGLHETTTAGAGGADDEEGETKQEPPLAGARPPRGTAISAKEWQAALRTGTCTRVHPAAMAFTCTRILAHLARYALAHRTTLGMLYAQEYSHYELQRRVCKIGDEALECFAQFLTAAGIPHHRALRFTVTQTIFTPPSGGKPWLGAMRYRVMGHGSMRSRRLLALHGSAKDAGLLLQEALQEGAQLVASGFAPVDDDAAAPETPGQHDGRREPCTVFYLHPPFMWSKDAAVEQLSTGAEYTGNESEDGELRATFGTAGLFLPPSPQLHAWYVRHFAGESIPAAWAPEHQVRRTSMASEGAP